MREWIFEHKEKQVNMWLASEMTCRSCEKPLRGRIDKKFCDDSCRNNFNNRVKSEELKMTRRVNSILHRNRRILKELYAARKFRVKKATLSQLGYAFDYHTHRYPDRRRTCVLCYEYGLESLKTGDFRVIRDLSVNKLVI